MGCALGGPGATSGLSATNTSNMIFWPSTSVTSLRTRFPVGRVPSGCGPFRFSQRIYSRYTIKGLAVRSGLPRLGRQSRCQVIHGSRYYIWDRPLWRIYVQREAVAFEVPEVATPKGVFEALADYREALRLAPPGYESEL
jgi:hypothetical protein